MSPSQHKPLPQFALAAMFLLLLLATAAVYGPGLDGPLFLDDHANLKGVEAVDAGHWGEAVFGNESGPLGRPVSMATFALNRFTSPGDVGTMKHTNLMVHLLCGTLVFWLAALLFRELEVPYAYTAALWTAAAWMLSPLFSSTVLYVVQRMAQLTTLFMLAGLISYVAGRRIGSTRPRTGAILIGATFVFWTPLAVLAKENGALLPLLALTVEAFIFRWQGTPRMRRALSALYVAFLLLPVLGAGLYYLVQFSQAGGLTETMPGRTFSRWERLLTQPRALFDYGANLFAPAPSALGVYHDDFRLSTGLLQPATTLPALLGLVAIAGFIIHSLRSGRHRPVAFGLAFFLAGHALESSVFNLELYFEHRNYLPGVGLLLAGAWLLATTARHQKRLRWFVALLALAVPAAYGTMTQGRAEAMASLPALLTDAVRNHPDSIRVNTDIAVFYAESGQIRRALAYAERVTQLSRGRPPSLALLPPILHCMARTTPPPGTYDQVARDLNGRPDRDFGHYLEVLSDMSIMGLCGSVDLGLVGGAIDRAFSGQQVDTRYLGWKHHAWLAKILAEAGRFGRAESHALQASALNPEQPVPAMMVLHYRLKRGDESGARAQLTAVERRFAHLGGTVAENIQFYQRLLNGTDPAARAGEQ